MDATTGDASAVPDELVEWVDDDGRVIEVVPRARMRAANLLHRSVAIIVHARDGRLLVHRRSDSKDLHPGWWDVAAGGVVGVAESYAAAARRELAEELGIRDVAPRWIADGRWDDAHSRELCRIYRVVSDGPYAFVDGEVAEARLVTLPELDELIATVPFLPGALGMVLPHVSRPARHER